MAATANTAAQLRRPGDNVVTVSITDIDTVALTGNVGDEVLLVTLHDDPVPELR
jgi:dTDP-4-amino-4,6-dideoxygalactose transaminase